MNWPSEYLGKNWEIGSNGPDSFDCWGLLADIYKKQKGVDLSRYQELDKSSKSKIADQIKNSIKDQWDLLEKPIHLCAVGLSNLPDKIFHVGCFIQMKESYVIHTRSNYGVMIEPLDKIILDWRYISFYGLR